MQGRIGQQMADRDRFVAAMSHDFRTPLTRLALRVERLQDAADCQQFAQDIQKMNAMNAMIAGTLDYLRGAVVPEPRVRLDVTSLLESLVDDQRDCGHEVEFSG
jgi:signal transduction histidine kinase